MEKVYLDKSVYEAFQERMDFVFSEFQNIYIGFSGGKDSGLLLNLVLQYMEEHSIRRPVGLFHQDFEAQYAETVRYVDRTFAGVPDFVERYWYCVPMAVRNAMSNYEPWWYPWDPAKRDLWVRSMPEYPYVVTADTAPDFYKPGMTDPDLHKRFGAWYRDTHGGGKTIGLLGLRAEESLMRYSAIINHKYDYKGRKWISQQYKDVWTASPMYDWTVEDVWIANGRFGFDYNHLYDLYHKAGLSLTDMRVASPFLEWAGASLNMYRIIEPETWARVVGRVNGANFGAIYGATKAMGYRNITLPAGHSWKTYTEFLLSTLPEPVRENYLEKFKFSMEFWAKTGGGLPEDAIREIERLGYRIRRNGVSNFTKDGKQRIVFEGETPDDTDNVKSTIDIPSCKRMCFCIIKNDHLCRFMGFGPDKEQQARINAIKAKYRSVINGGD